MGVSFLPLVEPAFQVVDKLVALVLDVVLDVVYLAPSTALSFFDAADVVLELVLLLQCLGLACLVS